MEVVDREDVTQACWPWSVNLLDAERRDGMVRIELTEEEYKVLVDMLTETLEYVHEDRTIDEVKSLPMMQVLNKVAPGEHARILDFMREQE
jgi:hypothetical protein